MWKWLSDLAYHFARPGVFRRTEARCSFCRKPHSEAGPFVEGPHNAYICETCIELSRSIMQQEKLRRVQ